MTVAGYLQIIDSRTPPTIVTSLCVQPGGGFAGEIADGLKLYYRAPVEPAQPAPSTVTIETMDELD